MNNREQFEAWAIKNAYYVDKDATGIYIHGSTQYLWAGFQAGQQSADDVLKCPHCDDIGWFVDFDHNGEAAQVQCEFCYTTPNSIFNLREKIEAAIAEGSK